MVIKLNCYLLIAQSRIKVVLERGTILNLNVRILIEAIYTIQYTKHNNL